MIILDTNVVSELLKPEPNKQVLGWLNQYKPAELAIAAISLAEMYDGLANLPTGKRRKKLEEDFSQLVKKLFADRILTFNKGTAKHYGEIRAHRKKIGKRIEMTDAMIAATARTWGFALITRDQKDFLECGINVINPWNAREK